MVGPLGLLWLKKSVTPYLTVSECRFMSSKSRRTVGVQKKSALGYRVAVLGGGGSMDLTSQHGVAFWRRDWALAVLLVAVTAIAYFPAWTGAPIWDDNGHLTREELRSVAGLRRIWTDPGATQQFYPLVHTVFWVEHRLWGDWPPGYHLLNIVLHSASALLLVVILRRLQIRGAWLAAFIFALHPIEVESVAWISELKNVLSGVFYLGSLSVYLEFDRSRNPRWYAIALGLFVLGLLSKSVIATLPGAILVVLWWRDGKISWKRDVLPLVPFLILGSVAGLFTAWLERTLIGAEGSDFNYSLLERFLIAGRVIWFYLGKLFWPLDLTFVYPTWQVSETVWWQYLFPAGLLLVLGALVWFSGRWRAGLAALLFFIVTLFPVLGFLNVYPFRYSFVADHFQYLASLGIVALVAPAMVSLREAAQSWRPPVGTLLCLVFLSCLAVLTWRQSAMYTDIETLWQTTIRRNPKAWMAYNNLGTILLHKGRVDDAILDFRKSLEIKGNHADAQANLGSALLQKGEVDQAIAEYGKALAIKPGNALVHYDLGNALFLRGQVDEAIAHYLKTLEINPNNADAYNNLGIAVLNKGEVDRATAYYQKALEINPRYVQARANLAWALITTPQSRLLKLTAVKLAQQANDQTRGASSTVLHILAAAYAQTGQYEKAVETAERSLQLASADKNTTLADLLRSEIKLYQQGSSSFSTQEEKPPR
jgi:protein O-mannosyl-transferase